MVDNNINIQIFLDTLKYITIKGMIMLKLLSYLSSYDINILHKLNLLTDSMH